MSKRERLFAGFVGVGVYAYAGYPLLIAALARLRPRPVAAAPVTPSVSIIIAAHNEAGVLDAKLASIQAQDYPAQLLEIIVASDGSTDATDEIARAWSERGVRLLRLPRGGKARALNAAVEAASHDILVLTDANAILQPGALVALLAPFADPSVGGVSANELRSGVEGASAAGLGERLYWEYDKWLKRQEAQVGSIVAASGSMYALYRSLYRPIRDLAATDDFSVSTEVVRSGKRLVFAEDAHTVEPATASGEIEFGRKVRTTTRGLRSVWGARDLVQPQRTGVYALTLLSHKVIRRMVGFAAVGVYATSVSLAQQRRFRYLMCAQFAFYALAAAGWRGQSKPWGRKKWFYIPYYVCMSNLAVMLGVLNALRRKRLEVWEPRRET